MQGVQPVTDPVSHRIVSLSKAVYSAQLVRKISNHGKKYKCNKKTSMFSC